MNGEVKKQTIWIMLRDDLHCLLFYLFQFNNLWASPIWGRIFLLLCDLDWKFLLDYRGNKSTCTTARRQRQKKRVNFNSLFQSSCSHAFPSCRGEGKWEVLPLILFHCGKWFCPLRTKKQLENIEMKTLSHCSSLSIQRQVSNWPGNLTCTMLEFFFTSSNVLKLILFL